MNPVKQIKIIVVSILLFSVIACSSKVVSTELIPAPTSASIAQPTISEPVPSDAEADANATPTSQALLEEVEVVVLRLPERLQAVSFEYSGLAWFGDYLVLMPQYPGGRYSSNDGSLFAIAKEDLIHAVENPEFELPVRDVPIYLSNLRNSVKGFEGFESILFIDQEVYLTIESHGGKPMMGYLIKGEVTGELESITLDPASLVELEPLSGAENATFEAMTYWNENIYVIYEHNSKQREAQPVAYQFNLELEFESEIPFPVVEYRVTDATISDLNGKFWVMNYFFPGDTHLAVEEDALISQYGQGATHANNEPVERVLQLQIEGGTISRVDQSPIYLQLLDDDIARNWEGLVLLDDLGFLIITDSFPNSQLGFCPILR